MITACLFEKDCPPIRANIDKARAVSVTDADLETASAEGRVRCFDCLEPVILVHREDGSLSHFRHHRRCHFRCKAHLRGLEDARKLIVEAGKVIHDIEERWAA